MAQPSGRIPIRGSVTTRRSRRLAGQCRVPENGFLRRPARAPAPLACHAAIAQAISRIDRLRRVAGKAGFTAAQVTEFVRESVRNRARLDFRQHRGHLAMTIQRAKNREFPTSSCSGRIPPQAAGAFAQAALQRHHARAKPLHGYCAWPRPAQRGAILAGLKLSDRLSGWLEKVARARHAHCSQRKQRMSSRCSGSTSKSKSCSGESDAKPADLLASIIKGLGPGGRNAKSPASGKSVLGE